jgi:DNA-binding CsgD family transcriptional regulator
MRTEVDLAKLTPYQREVMTALARQLSKNEVKRLLQIAEATIRSGVLNGEAAKHAIPAIISARRATV